MKTIQIPDEIDLDELDLMSSIYILVDVVSGYDMDGKVDDLRLSAAKSFIADRIGLAKFKLIEARMKTLVEKEMLSRMLTSWDEHISEKLKEEAEA